MTAFVALLALACAAGAQEREYAEASGLRLTLAVEKGAWRPNEAATVKIKIENATGERIEIPSTISFRADNRANEKVMVTTSEGVFWSPVSLTGDYTGREGVCQNDLTPERVEVVKKKVLVIHPAKDKLVIEKGEAKEFSFDLARTCWGHSIHAFYPSRTIFEAAKGYKPNQYRVYFQMQFRMRTGDPKDPRYFHLKSNPVEIIID